MTSILTLTEFKCIDHCHYHKSRHVDKAESYSLFSLLYVTLNARKSEVCFLIYDFATIT